jgi:hypothetical protein
LPITAIVLPFYDLRLNILGRVQVAEHICKGITNCLVLTFLWYTHYLKASKVKTDYFDLWDKLFAV